MGDHSVGKSGLGYRLVHGHFEEQASSHGQQFWVFPDLGKRRADGTECEAILWDLAGQPDYRLVHALFLDDADLALVLFDASDIRDPLHGVGFWLKQLQSGEHRCPVLLVAAQADRGTSPLTDDELQAFCRQQGIAGLVRTSARTGEGLAELVERMKALIPWDDKPATVTTETFKRIKDYVLGLKEAETDGQTVVAPGELRRLLEATDAGWRFTDEEMSTAVGHLENYGYVKRLRTSTGRTAHPARPGAAQQSGVLVRPRGAAEPEGPRRARGEAPAGRRLWVPGACRPVRGGPRRPPGRGDAAFPQAQRLLPRNRSAAHGAVPGLPGADQPEEAAGRGRADRGRRGLHGERRDGERLRVAGGAARLHTHLHAHEPVAGSRALRGGRRPSVRLPAGRRARRRARFRPLLRPCRVTPNSDAVSGAIRELPHATQSDGPALRSGRLQPVRSSAGTGGGAAAYEGGQGLRLLQRLWREADAAEAGADRVDRGRAGRARQRSAGPPPSGRASSRPSSVCRLTWRSRESSRRNASSAMPGA